MARSQLALSSLLLSLLMRQAMAQKIPRHVITQEDVAKALRTAGVEVDAPDVRLQADITSIGDAPSLTLRTFRLT